MTRQGIRMSLRAKRSNLNALDKGPSTDQNEGEKIAYGNRRIIHLFDITITFN
jgi:hypothetical protein